MAKFVKKPIVVEALQFTGDNFDEMTEFCGFHRDSTDEWDLRTFNQIGTFYPKLPESDAVGELWVQANKAWLPLVAGEWVIKDSLGFYPCQADKFVETYDPKEDD